MDRYKSRTAAQKLGILPSCTVALLNAPPSAWKILGELPCEVTLVEELQPSITVLLCFVYHPHSLAPMLSEVRSYATTSKLCLVWRKGGSEAHGDDAADQVRRNALTLGLVDYKICSVDETWTAMLFAQRR